MHNCKATRETLIALALNPPDQTQSLPAELETCATCREEYAALRNALRIADQVKAIRFARAKIFGPVTRRA